MLTGAGRTIFSFLFDDFLTPLRLISQQSCHSGRSAAIAELPMAGSHMRRPHSILTLLTLSILLGGCQSTHDYLLTQGYPPAFADGFDAGCASGRQAAGVISGGFRKDVPRYLKDSQYAEGWSDGFNQCQAMAWEQAQRGYWEGRNQEHEEDWQRDKDRAWAAALRKH
jgi:hypothetical protein